MLEIGHVTAINGDHALVSFRRKSGCGDNCASCGAGCTPPSSVVDVKNTLNASIGDKVQVGIETKSFMQITLLVYVFPLVMLFIGTLIGNYYFQQLGFKNYELLSFLLGVILLALSYSLIRIIDKKTSKNSKYDLKMIKIIS